jgi:hypothetical protein
MSADLCPIEETPAQQSQGKTKAYSKSSGPQLSLVDPASAAASSSGSSSSSSSSAQSDVPLKVTVYKAFKWQGEHSPDEVLSHKPLLAPLKQLNLDETKKLNVRRVYLQSVAINSKSPIGLRFLGVNGGPLDLQHVDGDHYTWATHVEHPGTHVTSFMHLNDGNGLLLHENELDQYEKLNSRVSVQDLLKDVHEHPSFIENGVPTHYVISANFAGFTNPNNTTLQQKQASMNHAAQLVYANAKHQINNHPTIQENMPGVELSRAKQGQQELFSDVDVRLDNLANSKQNNRFHIIVKANELKQVLARYTKELEKVPKGTDARTHEIEVFRPGQVPKAVDPKSPETIGYIHKEGGVTSADRDRSKTMTSTLHATIVYELEHPDHNRTDSSETD